MVVHPDNCYFCIKALLSGFPQTGYVKKGGSCHPFFFRREKCTSFSQKKLDTSAHPPAARSGRLALPHLTI